MTEMQLRRRNLPARIGGIFAGVAVLVIVVAFAVYLVGISDTATFEVAEASLIGIAVLSLPALLLGAIGLRVSARAGSRRLATATVVVSSVFLAVIVVVVIGIYSTAITCSNGGCM